jgi:hypothetical protein
MSGVIGLGALQTRADIVNWINGEGEWATPSRWSSNPLLPGPNDDAVNPTSSRIIHSIGDHTVKSFSGTGPFTLSGGSISAATSGVGTFRVDSGFGFTVSGGTLRGFRLLPGTAGRPVFFDFNSNSTLDNITSDANMELGFSSVQLGATVGVRNGLILNGTATLFGSSVMAFQGDQTLGGTGAVVFGGGLSQRLAIEGASTLTIGPDMEVHGSNGNVGRWVNTAGAGKLVNLGRIYADGPGGVVTIDPFSPALNSVTNSGILEAGMNATLNLNSHVTNTATGQVNAAQFGRIQQNGVEITGGTINLNFDARLIPSAGGANFLNGVKLNGEMDLATAGGFEGVRGGLTVSGAIRIDSNSTLSFNGTQTLSGPAAFGSAGIVFGNAANNRLELTGNTLLTLAANVSITGKNGRVGAQGIGAGGGIENLGAIVANVAGGTIRVEPAALTNRGTLQALQGGTLALAGGTVNNIGTMFSSSGGTLNLGGGAVTNSGSIEARAGGTVNVNTNVTHTGQGNITVTAPDGTVNINGSRITTGRINNTQGGTFAFSNSQSNLLDEVVANGRFLLNGGGAVRVLNGLTLDGNFDIVSGTLAFQGSQRLNGAADVFLKAAPNSQVLIEGTSTLRLGPGSKIRGGGLVGESTSAAGTTTLINEGSILSGEFGSSGPLTIRTDVFTNAPGGQLLADLSPLIVETNGAANNQGTINMSFGSTLTFSQGLTQTAGAIEVGFARFEMPAGKILTLAGGTLRGVGGVVGDVINSHGAVLLIPGQAFALGIQGAYTQGPDGRLEAGVENDIEPTQQLIVSGAATLAGTLSIIRAGGFVPTPYNRYRIMSYASRSGIFAQYDGTSAGNGLLFAPDYTANGLDLVPALPGDATLDRAVNFPDLVRVAQNYNQTGVTWTGGDFTYDSIVNFNDLVILAQRYNTTLPAGVPGASAEFQADWAAAVAQVPEPRALCLIVTVAYALMRPSRRR